MIKMAGNVTKFNEFVEIQTDTLSARGDSSSDIVVNLLEDYKAVAHMQFNQYINQKINDYDKGGHIDEERLMSLVENKPVMHCNPEIRIQQTSHHGLRLIQDCQW